jgi:hypothetical protein
MTKAVGLSAVQDKKIKLAVGLCCERCKAAASLLLLELHFIDEGTEYPCDMTAEETLLVLCASCHRDVHLGSVPPAEMHDLVLRRPKQIRSEIARILTCRSHPYSPPDEFDLAELYRESLEAYTPDLFQNGA